jgi:Zn-dependent protease
MALAGPVANLILALLAGGLMIAGVKAGVFTPHFTWMRDVVTSEAGGVWGACAQVLSVLWALNLLCFFFNLLPLPPLDGSALPLFFLRGRTSEAYQEMIWQPGMQMFGMVVALSGFKYVFGPLYLHCVSWLYGFM